MFILSITLFYRTTRFLTEEGFYNFHNWFDDRAWYPLGRIIGGTIYPGLMVTSGVLYRLMWLVNITIDIRNVCVFLAPFFSSLTTIVTYLLTKEIHVSYLRYSLCLYDKKTFRKYLERWCWFSSRCYDCYCSWLHFTISRWFL